MLPLDICRARKEKAVSPLASALLAVIIVVVAAATIYFWITGSFQFTTETSSGRPLLLIDEVVVLEDEKKPEYAYGFDVYIKNTGNSPAHIPTTSLLVMRSGEIIARGTILVFDKDYAVINPGDTVKLRYYADRIIPGGSYILKVLSREGVAAAFKVSIQFRLVGKTVIHKVGTSNTESNKVISEDKYAWYKTWWTPYQEDSKMIYFRIYAKEGITIDAVRAEIFNCTGQHPVQVGEEWSVWWWTTPYTYPDYAGAEWYPVKASEMPVTVVYTVYVQ